jgi:hypothetical protein
MRDLINVRVQRPKEGRTVTVRIEIQSVVEHGILPLPSELEETDSHPREALLRFLADITRDEPDGGTVDARCLEIYKTKLLDSLGVVVAPVPDPVRVSLPSDG